MSADRPGVSPTDQPGGSPANWPGTPTDRPGASPGDGPGVSPADRPGVPTADWPGAHADQPGASPGVSAADWPGVPTADWPGAYAGRPGASPAYGPGVSAADQPGGSPVDALGDFGRRRSGVASIDRHRRPPGRRKRRRRILLVTAVALLLVMIAPVVSYAQALTAPGSATWTMRTVDWVRSNHGNSVVNAVENWWYTRHKPSAGPPDAATLPEVATGETGPAGPSKLPLLPGVTALPGEATWSPGRADASGNPLIYTGFIRPDARHQSVVAGVAWIRRNGTSAHLVAGTAQPGGLGWPGNADVPATDVGNLVATFNSGFKMVDISGGFYLGGRYARSLVDGQASFVIDKSGHVTVGAWGRDVRMTPGIVAVRQNLALVVDNGRPVDGLATNADGRWGSAHNQYQYTWRSGAGLDASGNLVYVAGDKMTLSMLAIAMADAGIVRGMQLDIHPGMASFSSWRNGDPTKLLPAMSRPAARYLVPDQRDFFYVTSGQNGTAGQGATASQSATGGQSATDGQGVTTAGQNQTSTAGR